MSEIKTDRRRKKFRDHPEVRERAAARLTRQLHDKLALARDLVVLHRDSSYVVENCSTVGHFGARHLADPVETTALCDVGYALDTFEDLEQRLLEGAVPYRSAVHLGRLCRIEGALRPGDQWVHLAATHPTRAVRREVEARLEEVKRGVCSVVEISAHVTMQEAERFDRARVLASRKRGKSLSKGEALVEFVELYLDTVDPDARSAAKRRMGPTADRPGSRTIPREVLRQLRTRSGDSCEYPGCTNRMFVEKAHLKTPKAKGGGQEIDDLGNLCTLHHTMYDADVRRRRVLPRRLDLRLPAYLPQAKRRDPVAAGCPGAPPAAGWGGLRQRAPVVLHRARSVASISSSCSPRRTRI